MITTPLPLFPLGLVLLPGASVPLHIFEPRYRALLADVRQADNRFGLIAPPSDVTEAQLPPGRIGCVARITAVDTLPDGRANIVVEGGERFRFDGYVDADTPYRMGQVTPWPDDPEDETSALATAAGAMRLRELTLRAVVASLTLRDATKELPELPADPGALSFEVAQLLQMERADQYDLLAQRSVLTRLVMLEAVLRRSLGDIEAAAELHVRAKTNGHHHGPPPA